ncbi:CAP domain-containing protein [Bacillus luteolus]|uniref:CAP domain-containing protein n=2 Tax=Litchfieldia luteola TaxID=682179 RepID=A0ABR9QK28_9BACI|nr:CAP domain-containing protein [Cytobacillus luteolus]
MPTEGLFTYMGKAVEEIEELLGKPTRVDQTAYEYDWWIYNHYPNAYIQVGIKDNKVVTVYGIGDEINAHPLSINQTMGEIQEQFDFENTISLTAKGNSYRFELTEEERQQRPLVVFGDIFVQLYFDKITGKLSSIRLMDNEVLVMQRPYELVYRGELLSAKDLSEDEWKSIEKGIETQILDITNMMRFRHNLGPVKWHEETSIVAYKHSEDMRNNDFFSHDSPTNGGLADRLAKGEVLYQLAGENIAAKYVDGIAVVEGWLNSEGHRETLLNEKFTHLGVGVFEKYYTQNFIQTWE